MVKRTAFVSCLLLGALMNGLQCQYNPKIKAIPDDLKALIDSFAAECSKRGINVDISPASLQIGFGRITTKSASCRPNSTPKVITLDSMIWKALTPAVKEMLVYHELAHCVLQREHHTNDVLPSGECKSWMREDESRCKVNFINRIWRAYYIEELFSAERLAEPVWYVFRQHSDHVREDVTHGKIITTKSNTFLFDSSFFTNNDWMIEVRFSEPKNSPGSLGIKINEYTMEFISYSTFTDPSKSTFIKSMILDQFKFRTDQNILLWDTLSSADEKFELSIKKIKKTVYVFFENDLRACIPFDNSLSLSGYSAFKQRDPFMIKVYTSALKKK